MTIRFVCRGCKIPCSLDDHIDNASGASPFQCPWGFEEDCDWDEVDGA